MSEHKSKPKHNKNAELPELSGSIWFGSDKQNWGSQRRMSLLKAIDEEGSISAGAKKIGLSYKGAWDAVDIMNSISDQPLVESTTGGTRGGGARLTKRAKHMVTLYNTLNQAHERFISQLSELANQAAPDLDVIRHLMLQTSVRNKIPGIITNSISGKLTEEVVIDIGENIFVVANINREHWLSLNLSVGGKALVFIDASNVLLGKLQPDIEISARNQLEGIVKKVYTDEASAEVCLQLPNGVQIISQVTPNSVKRLGLSNGASAQAIFKASSVVLGSPEP